MRPMCLAMISAGQRPQPPAISFSPHRVTIQTQLPDCGITSAELTPTSRAVPLTLKNLGLTLSNTQAANLPPIELNSP